MARWLLPENIADVLPVEASRIERLRRAQLDLFRSYGYELVIPPLVEHIESLLTGSGRELEGRTFQLVDQLSGRILGLRADMTPQVARIDAHLLNREGVARLCYSGSALHARPSGIFASREPLQIGAELFGHAGVEADLEVIELMVQALGEAGVDRARIDLCHVGIVPALLAALRDELRGIDLDTDLLYTLLQAKDVPGLRDLLGSGSGPFVRALAALPGLYGPVTGGSGSVVALSVDLADLRGYRYHNGITFAAYVAGQPNAVARGGRYDGVGRAFGRVRAATGFSLELRELAALMPADVPVSAIQAPWSDDSVLSARISELRAAGEVVVQVLPGDDTHQQAFICDRELVHRQGRWELCPLRRAS